MATLQTSFLATTYGKDKVILKDVIPYLIHRIDPAVAVRAYHQSFRPRGSTEELRAAYKPKNPLDLEGQLNYGRLRVIIHMLETGKRSGVLDYTYNPDIGYPNTEVTILDMGKKLQKENGVWREIQRGVCQSLLTITLGIVDS